MRNEAKLAKIGLDVSIVQLVGCGACAGKDWRRNLVHRLGTISSRGWLWALALAIGTNDGNDPFST